MDCCHLQPFLLSLRILEALLRTARDRESWAAMKTAAVLPQGMRKLELPKNRMHRTRRGLWAREVGETARAEKSEHL
jgi:hypothetical protein